MVNKIDNKIIAMLDAYMDKHYGDKFCVSLLKDAGNNRVIRLPIFVLADQQSFEYKFIHAVSKFLQETSGEFRILKVSSLGIDDKPMSLHHYKFGLSTFKVFPDFIAFQSKSDSIDFKLRFC